MGGCPGAPPSAWSRCLLSLYGRRSRPRAARDPPGRSAVMTARSASGPLPFDGGSVAEAGSRRSGTMPRPMEWLELALSLVVILAGAELFTNGVEWIGEGFGLSDGAVGSVLAAVG